MLHSTIHWINHHPVDKYLGIKTNYDIHRLDFYPVDSTVQSLNNPCQHNETNTMTFLRRSHVETMTEFNKMVIFIMQASSCGCYLLIAKRERSSQAGSANVLIIL